MKSKEKSKSTEIEKIKNLEEELRNECIKNNLKEISGFTIMFDDENGRTILYMKDMPIEFTGGMKEFYDINSESFDSKYGNIDWPYTGFVQGHILGWMPISIPRLFEWLDDSVYTVDDFIGGFKREIK